MRHDSQYPLRQAHYVSHSTDFANRAKKIRAAIGKVQDVLMPQYGVYRNPEGNGYVLDVQADVNSDFNTRVVVPLLLVHIAPNPA